MTIRNLLTRVKNKLLYSIGVHLPYNKWRIFALRMLGHQIGNNCYIAADIIITQNYVHNRGILKIGNNVAIGPGCILTLVSHPNFSKIRDLLSSDKESKITIEDNAWLGAGVIILPSVTFAECSVVAAGAIVTKDVEPFCIVAGNPAKVIKKIGQ